MSTPCFHATDIHDGLVALSDEESRHALSSLRLRPGDEVTLFDGRGAVGRGVMTGGDSGAKSKRRQAVVNVTEITRVPPPRNPLTLHVAGCKGPRLSWLVEKATELGAAAIRFVEFERSVVKVSASHAEKLQRAALEACKQCGRAWTPTVGAGMTLADLAATAQHRPLAAAHLTREAERVTDWLSRAMETEGELGVVIGPEGGLTDVEADELRRAGAAIVTLGPHILRVETAAVAAAAAWGALAAQTA